MNESINFEKHSNEAYKWLDQIALKTGNSDRLDWAFNVLKGVLHTIRNRTTLEEVFHFSAQLPVLIRGIYFEGYKPAGKPDKMNADEFLNNIKKQLSNSDPVEPEKAFKAVLEVLYMHISGGELDDIRGSMPKDIQKLWDKNIGDRALYTV